MFQVIALEKQLFQVELESALVQTTVYRLFNAKSLSEPLLTYCEWDLQEQTSTVNPHIFLQEFTFEIVIC